MSFYNIVKTFLNGANYLYENINIPKNAQCEVFLQENAFLQYFVQFYPAIIFWCFATCFTKM